MDGTETNAALVGQLRRRRVLVAASVPGIAAAMSSAAFAHRAGESTVDEVVITGSRIARTGFAASTAMPTVGAEESASRAQRPSVRADRRSPCERF